MSTLAMFDPGPGDRSPPTLRSARGDLPLRAVTVRAEIAGVTADVEVEQVFENGYDEVLEVSYVFPLPDLAAVTSCELRVAGRVIAAKLDERRAAREAYAEAIERGQQAALAEQERPGVFTLTLGNLPPGARATVRFAMAYPLPREYGRHVFRFPLVVGERYVPGAPLTEPPVGDGAARDTTEVADASRISPPRLADGAARPVLDLVVVIAHGELGVDEIESSLHAVEEHRERHRRVIRVAAGQAMDRDFVLRFRLGDDAIRTQLWTQADALGDEGTFQLTIAPPLAPVRPRPRDVVLLLDRSGSMAGWKIVAARRALARMIDALDDDDRFAAYAFGSHTIAAVDLAFDRLHAASASQRVRAAEFLQGVSAEGGTEMAHPLRLAVELLGALEPDRDRWIVLVADGQVANEDALVALVSRASARLLALGIDDAVNSSLLRRLATATQGRVELVQHVNELEETLDRLHVLLAAPALKRVALTDGALIAGTLVPAGPLHVFPGVPLVIRGRYRRALPALHITGRAQGEPFACEVTARRSEMRALYACWAREQLLALEDRFVALPGERAVLAPEITSLSLRSGVLCRFTAFVAIDDRGQSVSPAQRHLLQPVEPTETVEIRSPVYERGYMSSSVGSLSKRRRNCRTQAGCIVTSHYYMSPEQVRGQSIGPPHEVFGLAVMLCELLRGERLFAGKDEFAQLHGIKNGELPAPLVPAELAPLEPVLRKALHKDPAQRHSTPLAFAQAVEAVIARATPHDVSAWLAALRLKVIAQQTRWFSQLAHVQVPPDGYAIVDELGVSNDATVFLAVRATTRGNEAVVLHRLLPYLVSDGRLAYAFLSEASLDIEGVSLVDDIGTDDAGGKFRSQPYVRGASLADVIDALGRRRTGASAAVAVSVIYNAARALDAALALPVRNSGTVALIPADVSPFVLRLGVDGRPVWTSLGIAPAKQYVANFRPAVQLRGLPSDRTTSPPALPAEKVSRWVAVPTTVTVSTADVSTAASGSIGVSMAMDTAASPRRRRWLRWWQ